jgi:Fe-S oxidoreductase
MSRQIVFAALVLLAGASFCYLFWSRLRLVAMGKPESRFDRLPRRFWEMLLFAFGQKRVLARPFGVNHFVIFWSFLVLLAANGDFILEGLLPGVGLRMLPDAILGPLLLALDVVSLLALVAVTLAGIRRLLFKLDTPYVKRRSFEGFVILILIALLMLASFGLHGAEIARGTEPLKAWLPISSLAGQVITSLAPTQADLLYDVFWWIHAVVLLSFLVYLPISKHMHILTAIPNCFFGALERPNTQPREEFAAGNSYGVARVDEFTWKDLFDSFTCTECGRCQEACPAYATGKPLNPRQVVHTLKANLLENADAIKHGRDLEVPLVGSEAAATNTVEAIWACTTCGACIEACPVFVEHMPKIVKLRRHLVQMKSEFPEELLNLFENMEQRSNPWGIAPTERTKWHMTMPVKPYVAGETEYLFFVGCSGAFDARSKAVTVALATVLDMAGVSWGILGKEEKCCGDSVRRLGNEYLFDQMARANAEMFTAKQVTKVITQCPHCFSTLKNDYRQYGLELEVYHHTEVLARLLAEGKIKPTREVADLGSILYHDSCYLGRHNGIYDEPRQAIAAVSGSAPLEAPRNRENAFCCGAGGGQMWMEEEVSGQRINMVRVDEAVKALPDGNSTLCVACPYCLTMFEDGLKDLGVAGVRVRDLAEVVADGLRPV